MKYFFVIILTAMFLLQINSCAGRSLKVDGSDRKEKVGIVLTEDIREMIKYIDQINKNSPASFVSSIEVIGNIRKNKFKSIGNVSYDRTSERLNITFLDFIFKSPVTRIFQDRDDISIYFPADKKLIIDNRNTINISNYMDLNIDYYLIHALFCGSIPVVKNYIVKQGLKSDDGKNSFLIIENEFYYETISFKGSNPDKFLLIRKDTREKIEIYLEGYFEKNNSRYFKNIRIIAKNSDLKLDFKFSRTSINIPVKVQTIDGLRLPRGVKVIRL